MSDDEVTMSIRKFLKKVGISSQQEIEKAYSGSGKVRVKMVLSSEELKLEHVIEGEIGKEWKASMTLLQKKSDPLSVVLLFLLAVSFLNNFFS